MARKEAIPNQREGAILAVLLHGEVYGREIRLAFERRTKKSMPIGSLYTTLDRMEEKGFIRSRVGEANPDRGGNRRKYYKITPIGITALNTIQQWTGAIDGDVAHA